MRGARYLGLPLVAGVGTRWALVCLIVPGPDGSPLHAAGVFPL